MKRTYDVAILGYYGFGNLGDELLLESVVCLLKANGIRSDRIAVFSASPQETSSRLGVSSFDRWNLFEITKVLRSSRSLLLGGGGLFQDVTSSRTCLYYWAAIRLARILGAKPWTLGQSVGPLKRSMGNFFAKNAFSNCCFCGVRDLRSYEILKQWDVKATLSPDLVMGMKLNMCTSAGSKLLLNLRPGYRNLAEKIIDAALDYSRRNKLRILPVALSDEDADELRELIVSHGAETDEIAVVKSLSDFEHIAADAGAAIGMRLHFIILSYLPGLRVGAGLYDPKVESFCARFSIPDICLSLCLSESCDPHDIAVIRDEVAAVLKSGLTLVSEA